jgi:hypothetical protein
VTTSQSYEGYHWEIYDLQFFSAEKNLMEAEGMIVLMEYRDIDGHKFFAMFFSHGLEEKC